MAAKKVKQTVKLNAKDKAKDEALALELKQDRAAERKLRKEKVASQEYSKDVVLAMAVHEELKTNPKVHLPFTPIVEKQLDLELSEKSLADYKADSKKGGSLNGYYVNLYEGFVVTLKKELKQLKKEK